MTTFYDAGVVMPYCMVCGSELSFHPEWCFAPVFGQCTVNLICLCCGDESQVIRIMSDRPKPNFARKNTRHEGARADYEDTFSYIRYTRRIRRLSLFTPAIADKMGVPHAIASKAYESFRESRDNDKYLLPFIVRYNNDLEDLPF